MLCLAAAVGTDGVVRFVDVVEGKVCCCIEPATQKQACVKMALDRRGNYAALITQEGEVGQQLPALPVSYACLQALLWTAWAAACAKRPACSSILFGMMPSQSQSSIARPAFMLSCRTSGTALG